MTDPLESVDLKDHPEADLSANAEKGAGVGAVAGAAVGAVAGLPLGPVGSAIGAVIGGVVGAVGTGVVVAATDSQGEHHSSRIQQEADHAIEVNSLEDDTPLSVARSFVDNDPV